MGSLLSESGGVTVIITDVQAIVDWVIKLMSPRRSKVPLNTPHGVSSVSSMHCTTCASPVTGVSDLLPIVLDFDYDLHACAFILSR